MKMTGGEGLQEFYKSLPQAPRQALDTLISRGGSMPWSDFTREFGEIREVGPGRRDRERHWRSPQSVSEQLWYRALIGRQFRDTPTGPREFAYLPDEVLSGVRPDSTPPDRPTPQTAPVPDRVHLGSSRLVDDGITVLAALRQRPADDLPLPFARQHALQPFVFFPHALQLLTVLLREFGALSIEGAATQPDSAGQFMTISRSSALDVLGRLWLGTSSWNDFALVKDLEPASGAWPNDPVATRAAVLSALQSLEPSSWWDLASLIGSIRRRNPGFARPGGEFRSWYLRDRSSGRFLRGFEHWEEIEGSMIYQLIGGPLFWLGAVDLGFYSSEGRGLAFRLTDRFPCLLDGQATEDLQEEHRDGTVGSTGVIRVPRLASRTVRYGVARMSAWVAREGDEFVYRLTPRALDRAVAQGLNPRHLKRLLGEAAGGSAPPALLGAIQDHTRHGRKIILAHGLVVKFSEPDLLAELLSDHHISGMVIETLGDRAALVREEVIERFLDACARRGVLAQPPQAWDSP